MLDRGSEDLGLRLSDEVAGADDSAAFFEATSAVLDAVFHSDGLARNHLDLQQGTSLTRGTPVELEDPRVGSLLAYRAFAHPIVQSYLTTPSLGPRRMSDLASQAELMRTGTDNEILRPLGIRFQASIITGRVGDATGRGWVLSRTSRDFSDDEMVLATRVQAMLSLLDPPWPARRAPSTRVVQEAAGLTDRELEVLQHVAAGRTAQATARILRIDPATVRKHVQRA